MKAFNLSLALLIFHSTTLANPIPQDDLDLGSFESLLSSVLGSAATITSPQDNAERTATGTAATASSRTISKQSVDQTASSGTASNTKEKSTISTATSSSESISLSSKASQETARPNLSTSSAPASSQPFTQLETLPTAASASNSQGPVATSAASSESSTSSRLSPGGIAAAILMCLAVVAVVVFMLWKFCSPIKRWREKRRKTELKTQVYSPIHGFFSRSSVHEAPVTDKGLGLSYYHETITPPNRFSFTGLLSQRQSQIHHRHSKPMFVGRNVLRPLSGRSRHTIKRKPVPPSVRLAEMEPEAEPHYPPSEWTDPIRDNDGYPVGIAIPMGTNSTASFHLVNKDLPMTPDEKKLLQDDAVQAADR